MTTRNVSVNSIGETPNMARRCRECGEEYYVFRMENPRTKELHWCPECLFGKYLELKDECERLKKENDDAEI